MKEYLPLGSIVILKGGEKTILIYGRKQIHAESGEEYDYVACLYPEGNLSDEFTYVFNNDQVDKVIHMGYTDDEDKKFVKESLLAEGVEPTADEAPTTETEDVF